MDKTRSFRMHNARLGGGSDGKELKHEGLDLIIRTHIKKLSVAAHTCKPGAEEAEREKRTPGSN